jgi:hypothetical protein
MALAKELLIMSKELLTMSIDDSKHRENLLIAGITGINGISSAVL